MAKTARNPKSSGAKKIVLLADGTGNSSASPHKTNVWRLYKALDISRTANQYAFYDDGVGTNPFGPLAIIGLTLGWGLAANVRQLYGKLCRIYKPGDKIYIFGFSRGAFTARVLSALITSQGVIDYHNVKDERDLDRLVLAAYRRFRKEAFTPSMLSFFFAPLRDTLGWVFGKRTRELRYQPHLMNHHYCDDDNCQSHRRYRSYWHWAFYQWHLSNWFKDQPGCTGKNSKNHIVEFLGVWDTVDAYGGPIDEMTNAWDKVVWPLQAKDRILSKRVKRACHALSLDEQRLSFEPMLWDESDEKINKKSKHIKEETITQVWFAGVHANVGGGYPDDSLALVSLDWMMGQSKLRFIPEHEKQIESGMDRHGPIYDNRSGLGNTYRYQPRNIEKLGKSKKPGLANTVKKFFNPESQQLNIAKFDRPKIHRSVFDRIINGNDGYAPINLPMDYAVVDKAGNISRSPEKPSEADGRTKRQEFTWNKVWALKVLHLILLTTGFVFVIFPYWKWIQNKIPKEQLEETSDVLLGSMAELVRSIPLYISKIPGLGFVKPWADKWAEYPILFLGFLFAITGLIGIGLWFNSKINTEMRRNWYAITAIGARPIKTFGAYRKFWRIVLNYKNYFEKYFVRTFKISLETAFMAIFLYLSVAGLGRVFYLAADGVGGVCADTNRDSSTLVTGSIETDFYANEPCLDLNFYAEKGVEYRVKFTLEKPEDWKDDKLAANTAGLTEPPWYLYPAVVFRRHLTSNWYQPILRVDNRLFERYSLVHKKENPEVVSESPENIKMRTNGDNTAQVLVVADPKIDPDCIHAEDSEKARKVICMNFKPKRTGQLFIFLNDAVIFHPKLFPSIYVNNNGKARVAITNLSALKESRK